LETSETYFREKRTGKVQKYLGGTSYAGKEGDTLTSEKGWNHNIRSRVRNGVFTLWGLSGTKYINTFLIPSSKNRETGKGATLFSKNNLKAQRTGVLNEVN